MGAAPKFHPDQMFFEDVNPRGTVKGHEFFDLDNILLGYVKGVEVYTSNHSKVAYTQTGNIYNISNRKMISLDDARKVMNCPYDGVTLAGYWYFFRPGIR
jgi:hypothetical protein